MSNNNEWKIRHLEYTEIPELKRNIRELREKVSAQQINNVVLAERIYALEEKERQRAREDHDRELSTDEQAIRDGRFYDDRLDER